LFSEQQTSVCRDRVAIAQAHTDRANQLDEMAVFFVGSELSVVVAFLLVVVAFVVVVADVDVLDVLLDVSERGFLEVDVDVEVVVVDAPALAAGFALETAFGGMKPR
jgi:hypothetical protein